MDEETYDKKTKQIEQKIFCFILILIIGFTTSVWACTPPLKEKSLEGKIQDSFINSQVVFTGELLRFENTQGEDISKTLKNHEVEQSYMVFKVKKVWKGIATNIIKFKNGNSSGCEYTFFPEFHSKSEGKANVVFLQKRIGEDKDYYPRDVYSSQDALAILKKLSGKN